MANKDLTPISIRLNEESISSLKREARRLAYKQDGDISYVDLIRDAVSMYISGIRIPTDNTVQTVCVEVEDHLAFTNKIDTNTVNDVIGQMAEEEWLSMFGLNSNAVTEFIRKAVTTIINEKSLPRLLLDKDNLKEYDRNPTEIIFYLSRRGAVPDQIQEGSRFTPPTFDIACAPELPINDIVARSTDAIKNLANSAAYALIKEENFSFLSLLFAVYEHDKQLFAHVNYLSLDGLYHGYELLLKKHETPSNLIMSPVVFLHLAKESNQRTGDWYFKTLNPDSYESGRFCSATILVSDRMPDDQILFFADKKRLGGFIEKYPPQILVAPAPTKLRSGFVIWNNIGMFARSNTVSCIGFDQLSKTENVKTNINTPAQTVPIEK